MCPPCPPLTLNEILIYYDNHDSAIDYTNHIEILLVLFPHELFVYGGSYGTTVCANPNMTLSIAQEYINSFSHESNKSRPKLDWWHLCQSANITADELLNNRDKIKEWGYIECNPNITVDIIRENSDFNWKWLFLTENVNITINNMRKNYDLPWDIKKPMNVNLKYVLIQS